jgi:hypothetical protein
MSIMAEKTDGKNKSTRTAIVPASIMEELPALSEKEREELLESLKQAEARVKAGQALDYDRETFRERLIAIYRG